MNRIGSKDMIAGLEVMARGYKGDMKELAHEISQFLENHKPAENVTLSGFYKNYNGGPSNQAFERALQKYVGVKYARLCTNGTSALQLALMAAGIGRGHRVAVPPLTFSATLTAVMMVGAEPVLVDVEQGSYNMDTNALWKLCETQRIDAVIPVHLLGVPCKMNEIMTMANDYDVIVIEDNAQALGASYKGTKTGAWGHLATLSFQETKVMSTLGEGGAVLTNNAEYAEKIRALRNHGQQYPNPERGVPANHLCHNMRMTEAQAAMGIVQLKKLDAWNKAQVENREILQNRIGALGFLFQDSPKDSVSTHYILGTTTEYPDREGLIRTLHEWGWGEPKPGSTISLGYSQPVYRLPLLKQFYKYCPVAEWLCKHFVWFDVHRWKTKREFKKTARQIEVCVREVLSGEYTT